MQSYKSRNGLEFYAATPETADKEFCDLAKKRYNLYLFKCNVVNIEDTIPANFFGSDINNLVCNKNEYLIIPLLANLTYAIINKDLFNAMFEPFGNSEQLPEEPMPTTKKLAEKSFYLDAGHGGEDPGACNDNLGLQEKIAALDICLKLGLSLEAQGAKVYYSRTDNDTRPALSARAAQANELNVNAFISIHLNSAANKNASGIETLCYSDKGDTGKLATLIQNQLIKATGWRNRGIKERQDLTVLSKTKMMAVLVECGFVSNNEEAKKLFDPEIQSKIANAICAGVVEFFN